MTNEAMSQENTKFNIAIFNLSPFLIAKRIARLKSL